MYQTENILVGRIELVNVNRKEILYYVYIFSIVSATTFLSLHILETRSISGQIIGNDILDSGEINSNIDLEHKLTRRIEKKEKMKNFVVDKKENSYGFHDEEWKKEKDNDTYRIAAIGDSMTEGSYIKNKIHGQAVSSEF